MCPFFDAPNRTWRFKGLERITITRMFFLGTLLYEPGWRIRTEIQDKAGYLWVPADCELSSSYEASQSDAGVIHKPPLRKQKRKEFWTESSEVKGP